VWYVATYGDVAAAACVLGVGGWEVLYEDGDVLTVSVEELQLAGKTSHVLILTFVTPMRLKNMMGMVVRALVVWKPRA
jgi:hypothetical protein